MKLKIALLVLLCFSFGIAQQKDKKQSADKGKWEELKEYPKPISPIQPEYPQIAKLAGIQGKVYVEALISENGDVLETKVLKSDHETLNGAAIAAIKATKFSPGISKEGKKVKTSVVIPMSFKLDDKDKEAKFVSPGVNNPNYDESDPDINSSQAVEKLPELVEPVIPEYPEVAKKAGITGKVFVRVLVDKFGNSKKAVVFRSDNKQFDEPSINAAMKSKFTPALQGGKPVAVWILLPFKFALDGDEEKLKEYSLMSMQIDLPEGYSRDEYEKADSRVVQIEIVTMENGKIKEAKINKSINKALDDYALKFVMKNDYTETIKNNKPFGLVLKKIEVSYK
ncbi:MAG: energy transducer TonB [Ignavibacteria bacterium]|nr:energy transducer TonB [Ignavibacteria bacterium]